MQSRPVILIYAAALVLTFVANYGAGRLPSRLAKQFILAVTAGLPLILSAGLWLKWIVERGFAATFYDPYFLFFWLLVGVATLATTFTALAGRELAQRRWHDRR